MTKLKYGLMIASSIIISGALSSCNKNCDSSKIEEATVEMNFNVSNSAFTKAIASDANETNIRNTQIFVFRNDGSLDAYRSVDASSNIKISCTTGEKDIYALVNAPAEASVSSKTELLAKTSKLADNSIDGLVMFGKVLGIQLNESGNIDIPVKRLVARLSVNKITSDFTSVAYQNMTFKVNSIYAINVAGDINYGLNESPAIWLNKSKFCDDTAKELLYQNTGNAVVTQTSPYETPASFYVYPNKTAQDSQAEEFSARYTRVVVETTLGDKKYYYPISIPDIESNKTYTINNLTITRPGSISPDVPVTSYECAFSVSVTDWETGIEKEMTI